MKFRNLTLILSILLGTSALNAQNADSRYEESVLLIHQDVDRSANNRHSYEFVPIVDTKAPKGFKPVYISHYGRHGSRYESNTNFSKAALDGFRKLDSLGLLTSEGKSVYADVKAVVDAHMGLEGALSPRGGREQQMLAKRMVSRFPQVFSGKGRNIISCVASTVQRCIVSMDYFTIALKGEVPDLEFELASGDRYQNYMSPSINYSSLFSIMGKGSSVYSGNEYDFSRLYSLMFFEVDSALSVIENPTAFVLSVYDAGTFCQDLDFLGLDIFRNYFTPDELVYLWVKQNDMIYLLWGNSLENGDNVRDVARPLLKDFLEKADEALLPGNNRAADLRFGHDAAVLPLLSLMGLDTPDGQRYQYNDAHNHWFSYERVPMGANVQMIFYQNKKGDTLVKILHNEQECHLSSIPSYSGPYYKWDDVREWFISLCK